MIISIVIYILYFNLNRPITKKVCIRDEILNATEFIPI